MTEGRMPGVTLARKVLASTVTIAAALAIMLFGSVGEMTAENAGITRTTLAD